MKLTRLKTAALAAGLTTMLASTALAADVKATMIIYLDPSVQFFNPVVKGAQDAAAAFGVDLGVECVDVICVLERVQAGEVVHPLRTVPQGIQQARRCRDEVGVGFCVTIPGALVHSGDEPLQALAICRLH